MTIKTVTFMSRADMERKLKKWDFPPNSFAIGINDSSEERRVLANLMFECEDLQSFTTICLKDDSSCQEARLTRLVNRIENIVEEDQPEHIFINCFAGVSRSAAVAKYINDRYSLNDKRIQNYTQHNLDIYEQMCKIGNVRTLKQHYEGME